jgi:hypothetical protein
LPFTERLDSGNRAPGRLATFSPAAVMAARTSKRPRERPLELWERVEGFNADGVPGTIVMLASDTVTVQLDGPGAQRVVVSRVGSGATIIPPVIPAHLAGASAAVVRVPKHVQLERGDTVRTVVDGAVLYALVQRVSPSGALVCVLWRRVDELPAAWQFPGLSLGASFAGSAGVLELVLTTDVVSVEPAAIAGHGWACRAEQFLSGAVIGLAHVFLANLYFAGGFLQRLAAAFYDDSSSQQALILSDRVAFADCVAQCGRKKKDKFSETIRVTPYYWAYLGATRPELALVRPAGRTVSRSVSDCFVDTSQTFRRDVSSKSPTRAPSCRRTSASSPSLRRHASARALHIAVDSRSSSWQAASADADSATFCVSAAKARSFSTTHARAAASAAKAISLRRASAASARCSAARSALAASSRGPSMYVCRHSCVFMSALTTRSSSSASTASRRSARALRPLWRNVARAPAVALASASRFISAPSAARRASTSVSTRVSTCASSAATWTA